MMKTLRWMPERTCTHTHTHTCIHMQTHIYPSLHTCCEANYNIELRLKETSVVEPNNKHFILGNAVHFKKHWFWAQHFVDTLCETTQRKETKAQQKNQKAQTPFTQTQSVLSPKCFLKILSNKSTVGCQLQSVWFESLHIQQQPQDTSPDFNFSLQGCGLYKTNSCYSCQFSSVI